MFHDGSMWGWHWIWWLFWIVILIAAVILFVRALESRRRIDNGGETALDILEKRYAAGEISTEEYEERRAKLSE